MSGTTGTSSSPREKKRKPWALWGAFWARGPGRAGTAAGFPNSPPPLRFLPAILRSLGFDAIRGAEEVAVYLDLPRSWERFLEPIGLQGPPRAAPQDAPPGKRGFLRDPGRAGGPLWPRDGGFSGASPQEPKRQGRVHDPGDGGLFPGSGRPVPRKRLAESSLSSGSGRKRWPHTSPSGYRGSNTFITRGTTGIWPVEPGDRSGAYCIRRAIEGGKAVSISCGGRRTINIAWGERKRKSSGSGR